MSALIRTAQFMCPLLVFSAIGIPIGRWAAHAVFASIFFRFEVADYSSIILLKCLGHLESLFGAPQNIVNLASRVQSSEYLIL